MTEGSPQALSESGPAPRVLIVDDEPSIREVLEIFFEQRGFEVTLCEDALQAEQVINASRFSLILTDLRLPKGGGMKVLDVAQASQPSCPIVMMTAFASTSTAIEAMKRGAYDYLIKPFELDALEVISQKAIKHGSLLQENQALKARLAQRGAPLEGMIGQSEQMRALFHMIERIAPSKTPVLILGESGTGKEMVAQAIHKLSPRASGPFVVMNCAAIPEHLFESELFGHVRGAFTGASERRVGLFQAAHGGTLFLDEVGEMPLAMQAKVLRAIQFMRVKAVGATEEVAVDIRILSATNRSLSEDVQSGLFREDLYYRLNVIPVTVPPLRERSADIPLLVEHFLSSLSKEQARTPPRLAPGLMSKLLSAPLPGNVRELKNLVERALALSQGQLLTEADFMFSSAHHAPASPQATLALSMEREPTEHEAYGSEALLEAFVAQVEREAEREGERSWSLERHLERLEERLVYRALERTGGNRTEAAQLLGISFRSIRYRLKKMT